MEKKKGKRREQESKRGRRQRKRTDRESDRQKQDRAHSESSIFSQGRLEKGGSELL